MLKERECSVFPAHLGTAILEPILLAYQEPACPVFIVDCELWQGSHGLKKLPLRIPAPLSCPEQSIVFLVGKDHLNLMCPVWKAPFLENSSLFFKTQCKWHFCAIFLMSQFCRSLTFHLHLPWSTNNLYLCHS